MWKVWEDSDCPEALTCTESLWLEKAAPVSGAAALASFGNPAQTHLRPYLARAGVTTLMVCRQNNAVGSRPQHAGGEGQCG